MSHVQTTENLKIISMDVKDLRFPTSLHADGSDAMHNDPDYSCAYVTIKIQTGLEGHGLTFTLGRGTEIVVKAIQTLSALVVGQVITDIYREFGSFWRTLTSESQLRWVIWQLLADLEPEQLVSCIDFRYLSNVITKEEALELLKEGREGKEERVNKLLEVGYPCYTTQAGWLGYSNEKISELVEKYLDLGFTAFKLKVGKNLYDDIKRLEFVRNIIGYDKILMVDANQVWEVQEAIDWMAQLAQFKPLWIEEPTSPDDVLGHAQISKALHPLGISVASGEMCCNRVLFKQFLQADAIQYCQIDSARIGGVNEILSVYLMAKKLGVKVCPHAGGVGLCEMVQHLQMWDYVALSGTSEGRFIEYIDQQHEHFVNPTIVENAHYLAPRTPGYNTTFKKEAIENYIYPEGKEWEAMFAKGVFSDPRKHKYWT
ncbi:hypothetical protein NQ314_015157 [Rhamnusium bicolor]|uniref:Mitochondrial enolase superfamily member 1 n=1 Tax=Rhamnusium bicolor TaxID=1586634 RepID=A0AAV8WZQ4_9CUCU|nr:hypothetical protein NQ314_015157 [Rhamnusium bicolor]